MVSRTDPAYLEALEDFETAYEAAETDQEREAAYVAFRLATGGKRIIRNGWPEIVGGLEPL